MPRVAIGGFQHETNTFSEKPSDFQAFVQADGWPGLSRGKALIKNLAGYNIGVTGLIEGAKTQGFDVVPLTWAYGGAGGKVTEDAFEQVWFMLREDISASGALDGILLDLHGAMVAEHQMDGEGELLRRLRGLVGDEMPIVACLDLHANISEDMVRLSDRLVIYRTYPHLDMAETGRRAAEQLADMLNCKQGRAHAAFRQLPFLIPLTRGCTTTHPANRIYDRVRALEVMEGIKHASFACGFNPSDVPHCGPSLVVYGHDATHVENLADEFFDEVLALESAFASEFWSVEDAVDYAIKKSKENARPIILADVQDNYGGGSFSDTTWIMAELVRRNAPKALVGVVYDPEAAEAAHHAGEGGTIEMGLGARSNLPGHVPLFGCFKVEALSDGNFQTTGEYFAGGRMELGPMALLRSGSVRIIVSTRAEQAADQAMFTHLGADPANCDILVLKSTVHYRADFEPIASEVLEVVAPAPMPVDSSTLRYSNLRSGMRVTPSKSP